MPELSLAKRASRSRKTRISSFEFSADQIEAVRQLVGRTIADVECELIIETLADQHGSRTNTAKLLGISIRALRNKIHEYNRAWENRTQTSRSLSNVCFGSEADICAAKKPCPLCP